MVKESHGSGRQSMEKKELINLLRYFNLHDPSSLLVPEQIEGSMHFRIFEQRALEIWLENGSEVIPMRKTAEGFFEADVNSKNECQDVLVCFKDESGYVDRRHYAYAFKPVVENELLEYQTRDLFNAYEFLGARSKEVNGVRGINFTVYAPSARCVSVMGNFNHWSKTSNPMFPFGRSGIWALFIPDISEGEVYKFGIKGAHGEILEKSDPYAFQTELRPRTGSVVAFGKFEWNDRKWLRDRALDNQEEKPISIYEVHLGSWLRKDQSMYESYLSIEEKLIPYLEENGFTHVEFMPVMEHPLDDSWGYQITSYFAPTSRFGNPDGLKHLINAFHTRNIGVILDWVPAHFPKDSHSLGGFDGTQLYEYEDPRKREQPDWGTIVFDYSRPHVRNFLISNASYWIKEFHCDGLRIDAVSSMLYLDYSRSEGQWTPNIYGGRENLEAIAFLKDLNNHIRSTLPGVIMIAEESTAWGGITKEVKYGGLGFHMKWNMGWMHDTLDYFSRDPVHRKYHQNKITFSFWYCFSEKYVLPLSHDEVVYGKGSILQKMPGDRWQKFANVRLLYAYMYAFPGKKLLFMGDEIGVNQEWNFATGLMNNVEPDSLMTGLKTLLDDLNNFYRKTSFLGHSDFASETFQWIDNSDSENSVISFMRRESGSNQTIIFIFNFTPVVRTNYRIGVPESGYWKETINSDSQYYGGSGVGNLGGKEAEDIVSHGFRQSLPLTLPPLGALFLIKDGK